MSMIAILASEFNNFIVEKLIAGAEKVLKQAGYKYHIYRVPGAFELPLAAQKLSKKHEAVICLGAIIRGETPHFDYICAATSKGLMQVGLTTGKPIIFGVLTTNTLAQAKARAGKTNNKGLEAAKAAVQVLSASF